MEAYSALVGADGVVVLHTVAHVGPHVALVVNPVDAELDDSVWNAKTLYEIGLLKLRMLVIFFFDGAEHLTHSLDVFRLVWKLLLQFGYYFCCFHKLPSFWYDSFTIIYTHVQSYRFLS